MAWIKAFPEMEKHLKPTKYASGSNKRNLYIQKTLTGRIRGNCSFCQACNTAFQGLSADASKIAGWYLYKAGFHLVNFIHDEYIAEIPEDEHLTERVYLMQKIMEEAMQKITPDVTVRTDAAAMYYWSKGAKLKLDENEKVIPCDTR